MNKGGISNVTDEDVPCFFPKSTTHVPCCVKGDVCLSNNICYNTRGAKAFYQTGNYLADCTDPARKAAACSPICSKCFEPQTCDLR